MSDQQLKNAKINYWDKTKFGDEAYENGMTFFSTGIDVAIFARIGDLDEIGYSTLASSSVIYQEGSNGMPFAGKLNINKDNLTLKDGLQQYINSVLLHEMIHILGFRSAFFKNHVKNNYFQKTN